MIGLFLIEDKMVRIKEIFTSIQGEGPYVGYKQLFIRFCSCNLNCDYCDTDFNIVNSKEYDVDELVNICNKNLDCHSVSLTGGEPLLEVNFLNEFLPACPIPVYLETNGTLYNNLKEIIDNVQYISADVKLPSCTGLKPLWEEHEKFFTVASAKELYVKAVFDSKINDIEIAKMCGLCRKFDVELILQPKMIENVPAVNSNFMLEVLNKCLKQYNNTRLIPQVHKFINVI